MTRKLFILAGQSNAVGQVSGPPPSPHDTTYQCWFCRQGDLRWRTTLTKGFGVGLYDPVMSATDFSGTYGSESFGPELSMAAGLITEYGDIAILKFTCGATTLQWDWASSGQVWSRFACRLDHAPTSLTVRGQAWEWAGMAWMQGESDVISGDHAAYEANLTSFVSRVRAITSASLPIVIGRLSSGQTALDATGRNAVRAAQAAVVSGGTGLTLVDTDAIGVQGDNLHFTGAGYVSLGTAFAAAL